MTTLIAVYNSEGLVGRCDAKCYNAEHADCHCICRGKNHRAGRQRAQENARDLAATWVDYAARLGGLRFDRVELDPSVTTDQLF